MDYLENTRAVLEKARLYPKLKLGEKLPGGGIKPLGAKTVEIVSDRLIKKIDPKDSKEKIYMRYILKHNGEMRRYETRLNDDNGDPSYLVQRMGEFKPGDVITMEMKKTGVKNYVEVTSDLDDPEDGHEIPTDDEVPPDDE